MSIASPKNYAATPQCIDIASVFQTDWQSILMFVKVVRYALKCNCNINCLVVVCRPRYLQQLRALFMTARSLEIVMEIANCPKTTHILGALLEVWPEHAKLMSKSFVGRSDALNENVEKWAERILKVIASSGISLRQYCEDYKFLSEKFIEEEIYFRRHGTYRLSKFADAEREVYANRDVMERYVRMIPLTHLVWTNHSEAMYHYEHSHLSKLKPDSKHLEIGPGHGLLLYIAANHPNITDCYGWDVSASSIDQTKKSLAALGTRVPVKLELQDLFKPRADRIMFDSIVLSEVLEHLEDPVGALQHVSKNLSDNGHIWINVPINSPAPDHIYLLRTMADAVKMVEDAGMKVADADYFPMTGVNLEKAVKHELTITAVMRARKA